MKADGGERVCFFHISASLPSGVCGVLLFHFVRYLGVSLLSILGHFFFLFVVAYNAFYCLINYCVRYFR